MLKKKTINAFKQTYLEKYGIKLTDIEVKNIITQFNFLANAWLDRREKEIFKGKTIRELLTASDVSE